MLLDIDGPAAAEADEDGLLLLAAVVTERAARVEPLMALLALAFSLPLDEAGLLELARDELGSILTWVGLGLGAGGGTGEAVLLCGIASAMFLHEMGKASI